MRMRKMKNLDVRMEHCAALRIAEPAALKVKNNVFVSHLITYSVTLTVIFATMPVCNLISAV